MNSLSFIVEGVKPSAKKNSLRPKFRGGFYTDSRVAPYEVALQAAAIEAMQATGFEMLTETPFTLHFHLAVRSYGSIDMDNAITTSAGCIARRSVRQRQVLLQESERRHYWVSMSW